jgi:anti-sigma regulatory factor (Ser/Thr protein kinase)
MKKDLEIAFAGISEDRSKFIQWIKDEVIPFIGSDTYLWEIFTSLIVEAVKNIYDHAKGHGYIKLKKDGKTITFKIRDFSSKTFDFNALQESGTTKSIHHDNKGLGLKLIPQLAEQLNIDLLIDTSKGFRYEGVWHYTD